MKTNVQPTFATALTSWKLAVVGQNHDNWPQEIQAATPEDFTLLAAEMARTKIAANKVGYLCQFNKGGTSSRKVAWIISGGHTLRVVFKPGAKRPQAATETSRAAYKTVNLGERCEEVARAAIRLGECTDSEVARQIGTVPSSISARRNDIDEAGGITVDGTHYVLEMTGTTRKDAVSNRSGNVWKLKPVVENKPAVEGAQIEMFI